MPWIESVTRSRRRNNLAAGMSKQKYWILILLPLVLLFISLFIGRYFISPVTLVQVIWSKIAGTQPAWPDAVETVIFQVRFPRTIVAMFVGAGLSISGAAFQGMFKNPLVSPDLLGVASGAGFGAALAILISGNMAVAQVFAFIFALIAVALTYWMSRVYRTSNLLMLVLSGVVVGALFTAFIGIIKFVADPYDKLPAITYWLMGSLSGVTPKEMWISVPVIGIGSIGLLLVRWKINILSIGDEEARSLGINTELLKIFVIVLASVITASAVCVGGMIGWVGLVIPHVARMIVGPDHRVLLPACLAIGASYLLLIDDIARTLITSEIPLGILTAIVGAPFFGYLLRKTKGAWA
jgi:iron complex transport system permease protein